MEGNLGIELLSEFLLKTKEIFEENRGESITQISIFT